MLLPQLRIKVLAVHVGLSPPLVTLKDNGQSRRVSSSPSLNNKLLIATTIVSPMKTNKLVTLVATVV